SARSNRSQRLGLLSFISGDKQPKLIAAVLSTVNRTTINGDPSPIFRGKKPVHAHFKGRMRNAQLVQFLFNPGTYFFACLLPRLMQLFAHPAKNTGSLPFLASIFSISNSKIY